VGVSPDVTAAVAAGAELFTGLRCVAPAVAGGVAALVFFDGRSEELGLRAAVNADLVRPPAASLPAS
jgi:hypothetical protein